MSNILDGAVIGAVTGANEETVTILKKRYVELLETDKIFNDLVEGKTLIWKGHLISLRETLTD